MPMEIIKWPDPILTEVCKPVEEINAELQSLALNMLYTLEQTETGVGLAAPQVGHAIRLAVIKTSKAELIMFNPEIVKTSKGMAWMPEGCLSFPGISMQKRRYKWVAVEFLDYEGNKVRRKLKDLEGHVVQHEIDHLDGRVMTDED